MVTAATTQVNQGPTLGAIDVNCKVREVALKILHQAWRAWFDRVENAPGGDNKKSVWHNHGEFRDQLVVIVEKITETFP